MASSFGGRVAYVRAGSHGGLEKQIAEIKAFVRTKGLVLDYIHIEEAGDDRPVWNGLMNLVRSREITALTVWSLDRIDHQFGSLEEFFVFLEEVVTAKVTFISIRDDIDTSGSAIALIENVPVAVRKFKSARKGERVHRSLYLAKQRGAPVGRPKERDDSAISRLRDAGKSIRAIASELGVSTWAVHSALRAKEMEN